MATVDAGMEFLLDSISEDVRSTFTPPQIEALRRAADARTSRHAIDYRVSIPLPLGRRYYLTVRAGRERRNQGRLGVEGQMHVSRIAAAYVVLVTSLGGFALFGLLCALYLVKSVMGINLFDGQSSLHPLYLLFLAR